MEEAILHRMVQAAAAYLCEISRAGYQTISSSAAGGAGGALHGKATREKASQGGPKERLSLPSLISAETFAGRACTLHKLCALRGVVPKTYKTNQKCITTHEMVRRRLTLVLDR